MLHVLQWPIRSKPCICEVFFEKGTFWSWKMIFTSKFTFFPIFYSQNFEFWFKSVYFSKFFSFLTLISPYFCTIAVSLALAGYPRMAFWVATAASFFMISSILISLTELKYEYNCWEKYQLTMFLWIQRLLLTLFSSDWSFFIARIEFFSL